MNQTPIEQNAAGLTGNEAEYKECFKCSFRGETADAACPKCGKKLRTAKNIRIRGVIQIVTGVVLVAMMIGLAVFIGVAVMNAAQDAAQAKRIAGERTLFIGIYGLFAVITIFGLNGIAMGAWQLTFGRRNKVFIWIMIALLAIIIMACVAVSFVLK
jgi:hypothetical protein